MKRQEEVIFSIDNKFKVGNDNLCVELRNRDVHYNGDLAIQVGVRDNNAHRRILKNLCAFHGKSIWPLENYKEEAPKKNDERVIATFTISFDLYELYKSFPVPSPNTEVEYASKEVEYASKFWNSIRNVLPLKMENKKNASTQATSELPQVECKEGNKTKLSKNLSREVNNQGTSQSIITQTKINRVFFFSKGREQPTVYIPLRNEFLVCEALRKIKRMGMGI